MADEMRVTVIAQVDEASSADYIEGQLPSLSKKIKERIKLGAEIDEKSLLGDVSSQVRKAAIGNRQPKVPIELSIKEDTLKRLLDQQVKTLKKRAEKIEAPLDWTRFNNEYSRNSLAGFKQASKEIQILREQTTSWGAGLAKLMPMNPAENLSKNIANAAVDIDKLKMKFEGLRTGIPKDAILGFEKLSQLQREMSAIPSDDIEKRSAKYNKFSSLLSRLTTNYEALNVQQKRIDQGVAFDTTEKRAQKLLKTVENLRIKYSAFLNDRALVAQYNQLFDAAKVAKTAKEQANVNAQMGKFVAMAEASGKAQRSFSGELSNNVKKLGTWMLLGTAMASAFRGVRDIVANVKAIDQAMVSLKKVTDETDATYSKFLVRASANAVKFGTTVSNMVKAVSEFAKMGYDLNTSETLAEAANIYLNVGDDVGSIEQSTSTIISTLKGMGMAASDAIKIVDKLNNVSNKYAVSSGDLGAGLRNSAAAMSLYGDDIDHVLAMLTSMTEITQDASESGNALKILSMRIRGMKGELESLGEEYENVQAVSKIQTQILNKTGVNIMSDTDPKKFKSTYDIMLGISKVYDSLAQTDQASVLEILAGKHRGNSVAALLKSMSQAENVLKDSMSSTGSAYSEHAKWLDSIQAKQQKAEAQFQSFSSAILDSGLIKGTYDAGSGILGFLTKATDLLDAFPVLATVAAGALSAKLPSIFDNSSGKFGLSESFTSFTGKKKPYEMLETDVVKKTLQEWNAAFNGGTETIKKFNQAHDDAGIKAYVAQLNGAKGTLGGYAQYIGYANQALQQMSIKSKIAAIGMKTLSMATSMVVTMGVSFLFSKAVELIQSLANKQAEAIEAANELSSAWEESDKKLKSSQNTIKSISSEYERLSKGIDEFGNNISLNSDEFARYNSIANQIADLFPDLISGWTQEGTAILKTKGSVEALNAELKKTQDLARSKVIEGASVVLKGFMANTDPNKYSLGLPSINLEKVAGKYEAASKIASLANEGENNQLLSYISGLAPAEMLKEAGIDVKSLIESGVAKDAADAIRQNGDFLSAYVRSLSAQMGAFVEQVRAIPKAFLEFDDVYTSMQPQIKSLVEGVIDSLDTEFYRGFGENTTAMSAWINQNVIDAFASNEIQGSLSDILSSKSLFDESKISAGLYDSALERFRNSIKSLAPEVQNSLLSKFTPDIEPMLERAKTLLQDEYDGLVRSLTLEELTIAYKFENKGQVTWDEFLANIEKTKQEAALSLDSLSSSVSELFASQSTANEVLKAQGESALLSSENYSKLIDANNEYTSAVGYSTGVLTASSQKIDEINQKKAEQLQSDINLAKSNALKEYQTNALELVTKQKTLNQAREQGLDMNLDWIKSLETEVKTLENTQDGLNDSILGYDRLTSELQYATSAYKKWLDVQSSPESGDQYRGTVDAIKRLKELIKEGRIGTREYQAAADLVIPKEVQEKGISEVKKYISAYEKYFTEGSKGAIKFAKDLAKTKDESGNALASFDSKTNKFEVFSNDLSTIATAMGITEDAAYSLFQMLNELTPGGNAFTFDNPQFDSTEQINQVNAAADAYSKSKDAAEAAQKELDKAKTDAEKAIAQQKYDAAKQAQDEAENNLYVASVGVGRGAPEELTIQKQIDVINETLAKLQIEIPATVKFDAAVEIAKILDPFNLPENQVPPVNIVVSENGAVTVLGQLALISDAASTIAGTGENPSVTVVVAEDGTQTVLTNLSTVQEKGKEIAETPVIVTVKYIDDNAASQKVEEEIKGFSARVEDTLLNGSHDEVRSLYTEMTDAYSKFEESVNAEGVMPFSPDTVDMLKQRWDELFGKMEKYGDVFTITEDPPIIETDVTIGGMSDAEKQVNTFVDEMSKKVITLKAKVEPSGAAADSGRGNVKKPETALVAEKRPEILIRDGEYSVLENPQLLNLRPGDQLIGGAESEKILRGRGRLSSGRALDNPPKLTVSGSGHLITQTGSGKKSSGASFLKTLEKLYDWIARALEKAKQATDNLLKSVQNAVGYIKQNAILDKTISSVKGEISKSETAYQKYIAKANEIASKTKLSPDIVSKIQNGSMDIELIDDKKLKEKIEAYQQWYDKAIAVKDAVEELKQQEKELAQQKIDNIISDYENQIGTVDNASGLAQFNIDLKISKGQQLTAQDYAPLIKAEQDKIALLGKQRAAIQKELQAQIAAGTIEKGSDAWYNYQQQLSEIDIAANEAAISIEDLNDSIAAIAVDNLKTANNALQQSQTELEASIALVESQGGKPTADQYNSLKANADQQISNMKKQNELLKAQLVNLDPLSAEYQDIKSQIDDNTNAINDAKVAQEEWNNAIVDIEISAIQDHIDALNEENDKLQRQYELQDKLEAVEKARQRTKLVYKEGVGFVRMADEKAVRDAERDLAQTQFQEMIAKENEKIKLLEDIKKNTNEYDSNGNPASQSVSSASGLTLLSDNGRSLINSSGLNAISGMLGGINLANQISSSLTSGLGKITSNSALLNSGPGGVNVKVEINNPNFNEVSGMKEFASILVTSLPGAIKQELSKK